MICKFCNAEMGDDHKFCPYCGKAVEEECVQPETTQEALEVVLEEPEIQLDEAEETAQEALQDESCEEAETQQSEEDELNQPADEEEEPQQKKRKLWPIVLAIVGSVVALSVLGAVLLVAFGVNVLPKANDINVKESYSVSAEDAAKSSDKVIATINGKELTNVQLQIYYRMQVMDFVSYYGNYASQIGLDLSKPFSEQTCYYDEALTWEQYFLNIALETWQNYQTLSLLAEEAGYTLSEDWEESLASMPEDLEKQATEGEYESVDAMLAELIGPGCTLEVYMDYVRMAYLGSDFYNSEYDRLAPADEEVEAYFNENEATFSESGITKDGGLTSSVRHILVTPKCSAAEGEECAEEHTEAEWDACYAEAEKILNEWKAGEATEESFAALATQYTEDTGSAATGGLYENVAPGSNYVESFLNWSIDMNRQTGDTEIVKTEYGYHIMYFVEGKPYWFENAKTQLLSERTTALLDDAKENWPMKVNYRKIVLQELDLQ